MGLFPLALEDDLDVDPVLLGREEGSHQVLFSSFGIFFKGNFKNPKVSQHTELCESSIPFDGIEAENFIFRKERKS